MTNAPITDYVNALGGAVVLALGVFALGVRPRTRASIAFGVFAIAFGAYYVVNNLFNDVIHAPDALWYWALVPPRLVGTAGIVAMALLFPTPVRRKDAPGLLLALVATVPLSVANAMEGMQAGIETTAEAVYELSSIAATPCLYGFLILLTTRFFTSDDPNVRRQIALTAAALTIVIGFSAGYGGADDASSSPLHATGATLVYVWLRILIVITVALAWLAATLGHEPRLARNMALFSLATVLAGLALAIPVTPGALGVTRLAMTAIFAYAVVKHQVLGIDVKVRWAISKSTLAAVFVAVFFVASELAQQIFGATFGGAYAGIIAAGALVFAMAPLQRAAERLAEKAVPVAGAMPQPATAREESYKRALRLALRDRKLTRDEDVHLHELAEQLGIGAGRAMALRVEVERELEAAS